MARTAARRPAVGSRGFWLVLALLAAAMGGLRLCTSDRGQSLLVRYGVTRHFVPHLATRLDVAIVERLLALGLVRGDIKSRDTALRGRRVREYSFPSPAHLTPTLCQLEMQRAARSVHGDVLRAELQHDRGEKLVLALGFGTVVTHRLVIRPAPPPPLTAAGPRRPRLALVIDDLGNNMNSTTRGLLDLGVPLTVAVLPALRKSGAVVAAARERGIPALLHLPMQPVGDDDPGKHPVTVGMSPEDIDGLVGKHCSAYKSLFGVNNHMGSRATADLATMRALMRALRKRDLVFVDSQTTPKSVGRQTAREAGVWYLGNDLFLDDGREDAEQVAANLERLAAIARRRGLAVGIGHPHRETLAALRAVVPRLRAHGIEFVTVESLRPQANVAAQAGAR